MDLGDIHSNFLLTVVESVLSVTHLIRPLCRFEIVIPQTKGGWSLATPTRPYEKLPPSDRDTPCRFLSQITLVARTGGPWKCSDTIHTPPTQRALGELSPAVIYM